MFFMNMGSVLKKNARRLVPKGLTLARTTCNHRILRALIGDPARWRGGPDIRVRVSKRQARALTKAMQAKVELLTPTGWR